MNPRTTPKMRKLPKNPKSRPSKRRILIVGRRRRPLVEFPPAAPVNLFLQVEATFLALDWEHNGDNVDGFNVYRGAFSDPVAVIAQHGNFVFDWGDFAVEPGVVYTYYLTAFNSAGESGPSNEVQGEIFPTA
jgi:hypothetical protein